MTIQPWVSVKYPEVSKIIADSYDQIEFRNQAAAQTDCLLQFKVVNTLLKSFEHRFKFRNLLDLLHFWT